MAKTMRVKLAPQVEKRGGGFVDPESGQVISKLRYDESGSLEVPATRFLSARIEAGELLQVTVKRQGSDDDKGDQGSGGAAKPPAARKPEKKGKAK